MKTLRGIIVELIARHLKNKKESSFSANDFLNISEIGIVANKVLPLVRQLIRVGLRAGKMPVRALLL